MMVPHSVSHRMSPPGNAIFPLQLSKEKTKHTTLPPRTYSYINLPLVGWVHEKASVASEIYTQTSNIIDEPVTISSHFVWEKRFHLFLSEISITALTNILASGFFLQHLKRSKKMKKKQKRWGKQFQLQKSLPRTPCDNVLLECCTSGYIRMLSRSPHRGQNNRAYLKNNYTWKYELIRKNVKVEGIRVGKREWRRTWNPKMEPHPDIWEMRWVGSILLSFSPILY